MCQEICNNAAGCTNIAYPLLVLRILPVGKISHFKIIKYQYIAYKSVIINEQTNLRHELRDRALERVISDTGYRRF